MFANERKKVLNLSPFFVTSIIVRMVPGVTPGQENVSASPATLVTTVTAPVLSTPSAPAVTASARVRTSPTAPPRTGPASAPPAGWAGDVSSRVGGASTGRAVSTTVRKVLSDGSSFIMPTMPCQP